MPSTQPTKGISKLFIILILGGIALVIGGVVLIIVSSGKQVVPKNVSLTVWGVYDDTTDLAPIINSYKSAHPYIKITYVKKRPEEYADALINGWATDTGPDVYALPNTWIAKYSDDFIATLPKSTTVYTYASKKTLFKTDIVITPTPKTSLTAADIKRDYADVVYNDTIINGKVYGLPLSVNTLVMYYNHDLLNQAHLVSPPQTWSEFTNVLSKITIVDDQNNIARATAALGTSDNITNAADIVTLLMLQNGTTMASGNKITFNQASADDPTYVPGERALGFYTDFASPEKSVYTWNGQMPNALDYFCEGKAAFYFGYKFEEPDIKSKIRGFEYGIAPVPQVSLDHEVNYANYWLYTVAKKSKSSSVAWNFLQYVAGSTGAKTYAKTTNQTGALRSIIQTQIADPDLGPLAEQVLTAASWYHGHDPVEAAMDFTAMVKAAAVSPGTISQTLTAAAKKIQQNY